MQIKLWKLTCQTGKPVFSRLVVDSSLENLDEISSWLPGGAYTTIRTFLGTKVIHLDDHLRRLEETATLSGHDIRIDHELIRRLMRVLLQEFDGEDLRMRVTVDLEKIPGDVYCTAAPLVLLPANDYVKGIQAETCRHSRQKPKGKFTHFISDAQRLRQNKHPDAAEMLMVDPSGKILEGLTSNFFGVQKGVICTQDTGILHGITRALVLEEAVQSGMTVEYRGISVKDIPKLDEAFITSSSRGVLPVTVIDEQVIGSGLPGQIVVKLARRYKMRVESELEDI
jgi:branched-chain amino acid aminotransferase